MTLDTGPSKLVRTTSAKKLSDLRMHNVKMDLMDSKTDATQIESGRQSDCTQAYLMQKLNELGKRIGPAKPQTCVRPPDTNCSQPHPIPVVLPMTVHNIL